MWKFNKLTNYSNYYNKSVVIKLIDSYRPNSENIEYGFLKKIVCNNHVTSVIISNDTCKSVVICDNLIDSIRVQYFHDIKPLIYHLCSNFIITDIAPYIMNFVDSYIEI